MFTFTNSRLWRLIEQLGEWAHKETSNRQITNVFGAYTKEEKKKTVLFCKKVLKLISKWGTNIPLTPSGSRASKFKELKDKIESKSNDKNGEIENPYKAKELKYEEIYLDFDEDLPPDAYFMMALSSLEEIQNQLRKTISINPINHVKMKELIENLKFITNATTNGLKISELMDAGGTEDMIATIIDTKTKVDNLKKEYEEAAQNPEILAKLREHQGVIVFNQLGQSGLGQSRALSEMINMSEVSYISQLTPRKNEIQETEKIEKKESPKSRSNLSQKNQLLNKTKGASVRVIPSLNKNPSFDRNKKNEKQEKKFNSSFDRFAEENQNLPPLSLNLDLKKQNSKNEENLSQKSSNLFSKKGEAPSFGNHQFKPVIVPPLQKIDSKERQQLTFGDKAKPPFEKKFFQSANMLEKMGGDKYEEEEEEEKEFKIKTNMLRPTTKINTPKPPRFDIEVANLDGGMTLAQRQLISEKEILQKKIANLMISKTSKNQFQVEDSKSRQQETLARKIETMKIEVLAEFKANLEMKELLKTKM